MSRIQSEADYFLAEDKDPDWVFKERINRKIGFGVFVNKPKKRGDFLLEYSGRYIPSRKQAEELEEKRAKRGNGVQMAYMMYVPHINQNKGQAAIDATDSEKLGKLLNDTVPKYANCGTKYVFRAGRTHALFYALRNICAYEELIYDYNDSDKERMWWRKKPENLRLRMSVFAKSYPSVVVIPIRQNDATIPVHEQEKERRRSRSLLDRSERRKERDLREDDHLRDSSRSDRDSCYRDHSRDDEPSEHDDSRCSVADGDLGDLGDQDLWEDQSERGVENLDAEPSPTNEKAQYGDRRDRGMFNAEFEAGRVKRIAQNVVTPPSRFSKRRRKQTSVALVVEDNAPSKCNICHMNFVDSEALIRHHRNKHMALHASRFVCQFCNCLYTDKSTLNRHIKSKHEAPEAKHECKDCKKSFTRLSDLRRHDRTMHGSGQVHECFFCGDTFTRADACRRHEREQHEYGKEVACSTCLTPFTRVNNMINHKHCVAVKID